MHTAFMDVLDFLKTSNVEPVQPLGPVPAGDPLYDRALAGLTLLFDELTEAVHDNDRDGTASALTQFVYSSLITGVMLRFDIPALRDELHRHSLQTEHADLLSLKGIAYLAGLDFPEAAMVLANQPPISETYKLDKEEQRQEGLVTWLRNNAEFAKALGRPTLVEPRLLLAAANEIELLRHHPAIQVFGSTVETSEGTMTFQNPKVIPDDNLFLLTDEQLLEFFQKAVRQTEHSGYS